jgi:hypothetical protein
MPWEIHRKTRQTRPSVLHPTPWFITVFTAVRQLSLFSSRSIEYMPPPIFFNIHTVLSFHLRLGLPRMFSYPCKDSSR